MDFLAKALEALPSIATKPLAFVGYVLTLSAWVFAVSKSRRLKTILDRLTDIPESDRAKVIQLEMNEAVPSTITAEDWIRARNNRYFLVAFLALLVTGGTVSAVAMYEGQERAAVEAQARQHQEELRQLESVRQEKRRRLQTRMEDIDRKIAAAKMEFSRGSAGVQFAPFDQKSIAIEIMTTASEEGVRLTEEKRKLQTEIDTFESE